MSVLRHRTAARHRFPRYFAGIVGLAALVSGCSLAAPTPSTTPYAASDGTNADLPMAGAGTLKFRNFLLVSQAQDEPGVLLGALTTDGPAPVSVQLRVLSPEGTTLGQTTVTVDSGGLTQLGTAATSLHVAQVPRPPGSTLTLEATAPGGKATFTLPVLAQTNQYATVTPTPVPPRTPSATGSARPSPSQASNL